MCACHVCHAGYQWQLVRSADKASPGGAGASSRLESSAASDKGSEGSYEPSSSHSQHSRLLGGTGEVEKLRTVLRQKEDQITSLQSQLTNLEATRDRWALPPVSIAAVLAQPHCYCLQCVRV